ncbi:MAG: sulfotransferase [Anaerolineales bacterium]|nr:sulfotransferase [Anaerolineales bacterium]
MPNFLIIGTTKAGTTSIYRYLQQHPQIFLPKQIKETNFFAYENQEITFQYWGPPPSTTLNAIRDLTTYQALFASGEAQTAQAIGEISPYYLYNEQAAHRIHHYLPQAKLIAILRHPANRAYSNYLHLIRDGREPHQTFEKALAAEPQRMAEGWAWDYYYRDMGYYARQLTRYYARFPFANIRVFTYEAFASQPTNVLKEIFSFLGVDDTFEPDTSFRDNVSGYPRNRALQRFIDQPNIAKPLIRGLVPEKWRQKIATHLRQKNLQKPTPHPATIAALTDGYRADIEQLSALTKQDFSAWLHD